MVCVSQGRMLDYFLYKNGLESTSEEFLTAEWLTEIDVNTETCCVMYKESDSTVQ